MYKYPGQEQQPPAPGFVPPPQAPPPYYAQQQQQAPTYAPPTPTHYAPAPTVVITQPPPVGPDPTCMVCPYCQATVTTRIEGEPTTKTHVVALLLCLLGCWCCAPFVYCSDSCLGVKHYCPNCQQFLGQYEN